MQNISNQLIAPHRGAGVLQPFPRQSVLFLFSSLLIVLCLIPFYQVLSFDFLSHDDATYVTDNLVVRAGLSWSGIQWAFTSLQGGNWHPLTGILMMAEVSLFGVNAMGFHAVNLLLHIANSILLFLILAHAVKLTLPAFFTACLFAVHPMHVESVAWIAELKDVLSTFFALWSILLYVQHRKALKFSIFFVYILSLLSKQMYVTLPVLFLVLDYWPLQRFSNEKFQSLIFEKIPYFILALIASKIVIAAHIACNSLTSLQLYPLDLRLKNAVFALAKYIMRMFTLFAPTSYYVSYEKNYPILLWLPCLLTLIVITALVCILSKKKPYLISGWLLFNVTLLPVIGIIQTAHQAMADRFTYFSYIGLFIMIFYFFYDQLGSSKTGLKLFIASGIILSITSAFASHTQTSHWKNTRTILEHAVSSTPKDSFAHFRLGMFYRDESKTKEAKQHLLTSIALDPFSSPQAYNVLGQILGSEGDFEGAKAAFKQALTLDPDDIASANNLGTLCLNFGKNELALQYFKRAIAINSNGPSSNETLLNLFKYAHKTCDFHSIEEFLPRILSLKKLLPSSAWLVEKYEQFKGNSLAEKEQACKENKQVEELNELTKLTQSLKKIIPVQKIYQTY